MKTLSFEASRLAAVLCDVNAPDAPIIACNEAFTHLTGFAAHEVIGRNCRILAGSATEPEANAILRRAIHGYKPAMVEITNYRKDGTAFLNSLMIAPLFNDLGKPEYFVGFLTDAHKESAAVRANAAALVDRLSPRQKYVLGEVAKGRMNKQIAHDLDLTVRTVKLHRAEILRKLCVTNTISALRIAFEAGL